MDESLAPAVQAGARWQGAAQVIEAVLAIGITVVLARLIAPKDFGLVALAVAVTGLISTVLTSPITTAIVVRRLSEQGAVSTAWWLACLPALAAAVVAAAVLLAIGGRGATLYAAVAIAGWLPLQAGAAVLTGVLQRALDYRGLGVARIVAAVVASGAALGLVAAGWGLAALVVRVLCIPFVQALVGIVITRWRPSLVLDRAVARTIWEYMRGVMGYNLLNQIMRRGDDMIIGSVLGTTALGYYSLSYRFIEVPISQVGMLSQNVSLPALSLMDDETRFREAFLRAQKVLVWLVAPLGIGAIFLGDIAVTAVLGDRWAPAGPIIQVFGGVAIVQAANTQVGAIYLARNATGLLFRWGTYAAPAFIAAFLIGLPWGPLGVAWSYLALNLILFYPSWAIPGPLVGLTPLMVLRSLKVEIGVALLVAAAGAVFRTTAGIGGIFGIAAAAMVATAVYWVAALFADDVLRRDVLSVITRGPRAGLPASGVA